MSPRIKNLIEYQEAYGVSIKQKEIYWGEKARQFTWRKEWHQVLAGDFKNVDVKWFDGAKLNITENCLDRHVATNPDNVALIFGPNDPTESSKKYTYRELHREVCKFANVLTEQGVTKGDRLCFYMGMTPELMVGILASARIGAIHSVVFGGFSAQALAERINDCGAKLLVTSDGGLRGDKIVPLKNIADVALSDCQTIEKVIVHKRSNEEIQMIDGRDLWWHDLTSNASVEHQAIEMEAESPLFILYTSGSTGKPKGVVHTTAGYMVYAAETFKNVFQVDKGDVYWCTADIGWITGHTYITYGPLLNGATTVMFEGVPTYPNPGRFWQIIEEHKITHFYTAPTVIRALEATDIKYVNNSDLSSLKILGSVGEPINLEAWNWYNKNIGKERCPIVDTWWQTETGGIMISPIPHVTKIKPCFATLPLPGVEPVIVDEHGVEVEDNDVSGYLCIKGPWPGMARTIYGDHERFKNTYFSTYAGYYFTGDGCRRDEDGLYRITGRVDDVINVSGHRLGTAEIEDAINQNKIVVESAVVALPHKIKGQGIYAFIICKKDPTNEESFAKDIRDDLTRIIGPIAKPDKIQVVPGLPKTRSGKIMRRILKKFAEGDPDNLGDISTLLDPAIVEKIKKNLK